MAEVSLRPTITLGRPGVSATTLGPNLRIAVPVSGESRADIVEQWGRAVDAGADIIEWRVDGLVDPAIETLGLKLRDLHNVPVIVTLRTKREGGRFPLRDDGKEYRKLLRQAAHWADAVDIEATVPGAEEAISELRDLGAAVIASRHIFEDSPTDESVQQVLRDIAELHPDIIKVAWMVNSAEEAEVIERAQEWALAELAVPTLILGMGEEGRRTRLGDRARAGAFTFAHVGFPTAAGQPHIAEVRGTASGK